MAHVVVQQNDSEPLRLTVGLNSSKADELCGLLPLPEDVDNCEAVLLYGYSGGRVSLSVATQPTDWLAGIYHFHLLDMVVSSSPAFSLGFVFNRTGIFVTAPSRLTS